MTNKKITESYITISRVSSSHESDYISIEIKDRLNGSIISRTKIDFASFALAITGMGFQHCETETYDIYDIIGKEKISESFRIPKNMLDGAYDKDNRSKAIDDYLFSNEDFNKFKDDGWFVSSNGLSVQQLDRNFHIITISKYIDKGNKYD